MKSAPPYKTIGLPWTLDVPSHWEIKKLKWVATVRPSNVDKKTVEGEQAVRLCNYVDVYKNDFITSNMTFMEATATASQIATFTLKAGDVLITKDSEEWSDIAVPAFVPVDLDGVVCGYHLAHIRPKSDVSFGGYLFRAFAAEGLADQFRVSANGITRYGLSTDDITNALFPVPPLSEQRAIAAFLDRKTAQIDQLIAKKRRLIEVLSEKRKAMIQCAVTQGLNCNVSMNDSQVPWVGSTPAHWTIQNLGRFLQLQRGHDLPQQDRRAGNIPIISSAGISGTHNVTKAKGPGVITGRYGTIGDVFYVDTDYWPLNTTLYVVDFKGNHPRFAYYLLMTIPYTSDSDKSAVPGVNRNHLHRITISKPPLDEQQAIAGFLDRRLGQLDALIETVSRHSEMLVEYRQSLISSAVTGMIIVQEAVPISTHKVKANPYFRRTVLAAEIVDRLHAHETFGQIKFQKALFLAEHHLGLPEIGSKYRRAAAGPFDNQLIRSVESQLERSRWYKPFRHDGRMSFQALEKVGGHRTYFGTYWGPFEEKFTALVNILKPMTTEQAEIVATLYAVWNDFIIQKVPFDDAKIVNDVLTNWDESKKRISSERWFKALDWMRTKGLVPYGFGQPTLHRGE